MSGFGRSRTPAILTWLLGALCICGCGGQGRLGGSDGSSDESSDDGSDDGSDDDPGGSAGCGLSPDGLSTTLEVAQKTRTFELSLPDAYDSDHPYPLILAWHGLGGSGELAQYYFGIEEVAESEAVIAYPDGLPLPAYDGEPGWDLAESGYDLALFDAMVSHLTENLCIDEARVFSTGHSFGGYMSNTLGCYRSDTLSAIAPVASGGPYGSCQGQVAAWIAHGSNDDRVELENGEGSLNTWSGVNDCAGEPSEVDPTPCGAYGGCSRDVHWCEHSGGHEWPSFAASGIWDFFSNQ